MERLTTQLKGGSDAFGMPMASSYDCDLQTAQGRIKARCRLGRYEDLNRTPQELEKDLAELSEYRKYVKLEKDKYGTQVVVLNVALEGAEG